jgi:hypothetical protein
MSLVASPRATSRDGKKVNARQFKNATGLFLLRIEKGSPIRLTGSRTAIQSGYNFLLSPLAPGTHTSACT